MRHTRKRLGDWEVDTLLGKQQKDVMLTLAERESRFIMMGRVSRRTAVAVWRQVCKLLLPVKDKVHTLTSDHGKEFAGHKLIAETLQLKFYFAHPYGLGMWHEWEDQCFVVTMPWLYATSKTEKTAKHFAVFSNSPIY